MDPSASAHGLPVADVAATLEVDPATGLDPDEVARRAALAGPNELEPRKRESVLRMVLGAATEPFVLLLAAAAVGAILLNEVRDGLLILFGLLPIVGADVITEYRGERALDALRDASAPMARVRRAGAPLDVTAATLVPGDVVLLRGGDIVPADLRLSRTDRLLVDRSVLTGESVPEPGVAEPDPADALLADRRSIAYAGTSVVGGRGEGLVVAIGAATEVGRIAGKLSGRMERRSPLQHELDRLVRILLVVAIALIAIVSGLGFIRGQSLGENVLAGISAAIAAIPEEPPVLLAVILGLGAYRLLKRGVLVRRLNAEEVLGAIDLIVTDKTGTLTVNRLDVASIRGASGPIDDDVARRAILLTALRAEADAWARSEGTAPGAFTRALERAIDAEGGSHDLPLDELVDAQPPTNDRPISLTVTRRAGGPERLASGAPEAVLATTAIESDAERDAWHREIEAGAAAGERLIGIARADGMPGDPAGWRMVALIGFADPLRPGMEAALRESQAAGIQTIVVTGDHPATAAAIARAAGLGGERIATGGELAGWDDERLARELPHLHIVARSTPDQKERIVRVARASGRLVAVTGDGVNDAPALHNADVAVAMGSGTAVAREAADLVLGDDSFATLLYGLREGRRIVDNIQKGLVFLVSTHVAFLGFILIATLAGYGQPLLPIQILWMELFIDSSTSIAFEREPGEPNVMSRPPRTYGAPLLGTGILVRIALAGGFTAVAALWLMVNHPGDDEHVRWLAYTALVCGQVVRAYANRSLRIPVLRIGRNGFLLAGAAIVVVIQLAIPFVPGVSEAFRASPLDLEEWLLVAIVALAPAVAAEAIRFTGRTVWVA
ncbi:MAG TPA: HAD-IC family P-type ATPase [Candidatus Limnocylindrales bacterium]|nr:HAD-IC family P-type ATPase [Candidatus Limnocylindrales bacterium]